MEFDDEPEPQSEGFFKRFRVAIIVTAVVLAGVIGLARAVSNGGGSNRRDSITLVSLAPPPPPPPVMTPPPPPQQEEQRMEQPMIKEDQPKEAPPKDEPPLGTGIKGDGPDSFGLSDKPGNGRIGGNTNGSRWGWYASRVQSSVADAMRRNRKTRAAQLDIRVRIWPDGNGRVSRAQLASSTGDASLDSVIRDEVLGNLQLQPPPADMPTPIVLQVKAYRPH